MRSDDPILPSDESPLLPSSPCSNVLQVSALAIDYSMPTGRSA